MMSMEGRGERGSVAEIVRAQRALYEALLGLGARQRELASEGDGEGVMAVMEERGSIIERLAVLSDEADAHGGIDAMLAREPDAAADVESDRARIAQVGAQIAADDAHDIERLRGATGIISEELSRLTSARRAVGAYGGGVASGQNVARFQDRRA